VGWSGFLLPRKDGNDNIKRWRKIISEGWGDEAKIIARLKTGIFQEIDRRVRVCYPVNDRFIRSRG
jgi:hypothetical protein